MTNRLTKWLWIIFLTGAAHSQVFHKSALELIASGQSFASLELSCPSGQSAFSQIGTTFDNSTGKYRQWLCFDANGNVTVQSATLSSGVAITIPSPLIANPIVVGNLTISSGTTAPTNSGTNASLFSSTSNGNISYAIRGSNTYNNLVPIAVNGTSMTGTTQNSFGATPAAQAGFTNVIFQLSGGNASAELLTGSTCVLATSVNWGTTTGTFCSQALPAGTYTFECNLPVQILTGAASLFINVGINLSAAPTNTQFIATGISYTNTATVTNTLLEDNNIGGSGQNPLITNTFSGPPFPAHYNLFGSIAIPASTVSFFANTNGSATDFAFEPGGYCRIKP